jgi:hypothetical protein
MIIKDFITDSQLAELLAWTSSIVDNGEPNFVEIETIPNAPVWLDELRAKCAAVSEEGAYLPSLVSDFVLSVPVDVEISSHVDGGANVSVDGVAGNYKHIRFVILLQKPDAGGHLWSEGNLISYEAKDCFVLDTSRPHELTKVEGAKRYMSLVYGFECKE